MSSRKNYSSFFKAKVVLAALSAEKYIAELTSEYDIDSNFMVDSDLGKRASSDRAPC